MLHAKLKQLIEEKKKDKGLDPLEQRAKSGVLGAIKGLANEALGSKLSGLKKVTVASNDPKGLELGLDKAKSMLADKLHGESPEHEEGSEELLDSDEGDDLSPEDAEEEGEDEEDEQHSLSPEEIDAKIQELLALKEKMAKC